MEEETIVDQEAARFREVKLGRHNRVLYWVIQREPTHLEVAEE